MNKVLWSLCHATSQQFASLSPPLIDSHRIVNPIIRSSRSFKPCTYQPPQSTPFMVHPSDSQQHLFVYDPIPPRSRQPTGNTFSRAAELQSNLYPLFEARNSTEQPIVN